MDKKEAKKDTKVVRTGFGLVLTIRTEEGEFDKDGEMIILPKGIKLESGKHYIKPDATQLLALLTILQDVEVKKSLQKLLNEERKEVPLSDFFTE